MTQPRHWGEGARQMGDYITDLAARPAQTNPRRCTRCQARLRHGNTMRLCAPCDATVNPWVIPEPRPPSLDNDPYRCSGCGHYKAKASGHCRTCANKHRAAHTCRCGSYLSTGDACWRCGTTGPR